MKAYIQKNQEICTDTVLAKYTALFQFEWTPARSEVLKYVSSRAKWNPEGISRTFVSYCSYLFSDQG